MSFQTAIALLLLAGCGGLPVEPDGCDPATPNLDDAPMAACILGAWHPDWPLDLSAASCIDAGLPVVDAGCQVSPTIAFYPDGRFVQAGFGPNHWDRYTVIEEVATLPSWALDAQPITVCWDHHMGGRDGRLWDRSYGTCAQLEDGGS